MNRMFKYPFAIALSVLMICVLHASAQSCTDLSSGHPAFKWTKIQPLILLTEYSPWAMAVGSESPTFVLYSDGTVIYQHGTRSSAEYVTTHLTSSQIEELFRDAQLNKLDSAKDCYALAKYTDAPTTNLVVKTLTGYKIIDVYGTVRGLSDPPQDELPAEFQTAFHKLFEFTAEDARTWKPSYLEVILWSFDYAKTSVQWPSYFPGLSDKNSLITKNSSHIFIPIADLEKFKAFAGTLKQSEAVLLDGQKWTFSARYPFPHEEGP